jgi:hypothetical protein
MLCRSIFLASASLAFFSATTRAQQFEFDISLFEGDPKGSREAKTLRIVSAPTLALKSGQKGSYLLGKQIQVGKKTVAIGKHVHISTKDFGHGATRVSLALEVTDRTGPASSQVTSKKAETTATIQSGGGNLCVELGDDPKNKLWVEITISKVK